MAHTSECLESQRLYQIAQGAWLEKWPRYCQVCSGTGQTVFSQSVPYGSTSASFDVADPCDSCTGKGLCARCMQPGLTDEDRGDESTGEGPCKLCGWNYGIGNDDLPPFQPECMCWRTEEDAEWEESMKEIDELEGRELDAAIAGMMNATVKIDYVISADNGASSIISFDSYFQANQYLEGAHKRHFHMEHKIVEIKRFPPYSSDIAAARQVEDRIEELGLQVQYIQALATECGMTLLANVKEYWIMLRATPEQRCRAALKAGRGGVEHDS